MPKNQKPQMSAQVRKEIESYAKQIKTIELFVDSVRKNPGEYLSSIGNEGWMNCVREVFQNGTDEMARQNSPCNQVWLTYYEKTHRCIVEDNGRALAPEIINRVFTREHTSANFDKKEHVYPSGLHGVGSKCVNAVSSRFSVYSYYLGHCYHMDFSEGKPLPKYVKGKTVLPEELPNKNNKQGLVVDFEPDFSIMREITLTCEDILGLAARIVPLTNPGGTVHFTGHLKNGKIIQQTLVNTEGVVTYLKYKTNKPMIKPIIYGFDNGEKKIDVAITYEANLDAGPDVITFANMTPVNTQLSTPSQGFIRGITEFFRDYMNKIVLVNNKRKTDVIAGDITTGLKAAVAAAHMNVMFDGQAKNVCKNLDLFDFAKEVTKTSLAQWAKQNPDDLQKLCNWFKDVSTARARADKAKVDVTKKYRNTFLGLPSNFTKAERKHDLELYICEGLSAAGPIEVGRNSLYQAVFPIRGKMPNAMSKSRESFLKNEEVQAILTILGSGYGKNFDISKCPYAKVVILADADPDKKTVPSDE